MEKNIEGLIGVVGSIICYLYGGFDTPVLVLIIVVVGDYITGMGRAIYKKKLNSSTGLKGFIKKIVILIIVAFGVQLDRLIGSNGLIRNFVIYYYIATEGLSILENCVALDIPFPDIVKNTLEQIREGKK